MLLNMASINRAQTLVAILLLAGLCWLAFGGALECGFVRFDDHGYVYENPQVMKGLTGEGLRWAFTTGEQSNWHPLTWLSHMADVELYGLVPEGHHLTSLLLHAANAILLFWILRGLTGRLFLALLAAALWAVHPLRVESVIWISERKDVLAMFFGLLALGAYQRHARGEGRPVVGGPGGDAPGYRKSSMAFVALFFALSLLSKPLWVTFPFVLLLLDFWPLKRWPGSSAGRFIKEKWGLFFLALVSCVATFWAQERGGAMAPLEMLPLSVRLVQAVVSYAEYVQMLFWPFKLAAFYPHPITGYSAIRVAGSLALLLTLSAGVASQIKRRPWLAVGWLWFLGALVPMIGLVQVGTQAWADRYTYLPHVGLWMAIVFGAASISAPGLRKSLAVLAGVCIVGLALLSRGQTAVWRTTDSLFLHAIAVTESNAMAHGNMGAHYVKQGQWEKAKGYLNEALRLRPTDASARYALAKVYLGQGRMGSAREQLRMAVQDPEQWQAMNDLAWLLATESDATPGQAAQAMGLIEQALERAPIPSADLLDTLAVTRAATGDFQGAIEAGEQALALPRDAALTKKIQERLQLYRDGRSYRE